MRNKIIDTLNTIEKENNVCIFYACESGSRAWGFPSVNSDYDVRFLYIHPQNWYLSIDEGRDVIEVEVSEYKFDISGWDIKKALKLFRKSNPPLFEWLNSPIVYLEKFTLAKKLRTLEQEYYSPISCFYHYMHMAQGNFREYLKGETVWLKKYFYILRPVLACKWIEQGLGPVPTEFQKLVEKIIQYSTLEHEIHNLLERKRNGDELSYGPKIDVINDFIVSEMKRLTDIQLANKKVKPKNDILNEFFRNALLEIWTDEK